MNFRHLFVLITQTSQENYSNTTVYSQCTFSKKVCILLLTLQAKLPFQIIRFNCQLSHTETIRRERRAAETKRKDPGEEWVVWYGIGGEEGEYNVILSKKTAVITVEPAVVLLVHQTADNCSNSYYCHGSVNAHVRTIVLWCWFMMVNIVKNQLAIEQFSIVSKFRVSFGVTFLRSVIG